MNIKNSELFQLDDRSREIFKRIVEEYLAKGFPIGSRTVSQMDRINLSAASIRNVMHDLESLGLIYSPHTSSGRIPTEGGLRLFVDAMLEIGSLTDIDQAAMKEQAMTNNMTLEDALSKASEMLSGLTNCTGVVSVNKDVKYVKHIEFVSLDKTKILVILVDEDGKVHKAWLHEITLNELPATFVSKLMGKIDRATHPKGYEKLVKRYVDAMKKDKSTGRALQTAISGISNAPSLRSLQTYINNLVAKGTLPKELKADYDMQEIQKGLRRVKQDPI